MFISENLTELTVYPSVLMAALTEFTCLLSESHATSTIY